MSFWFGLTYLRGKGGKLQWSLLLWLGLCYVLVHLEVGPIVADPPSRLLLTNDILCKGLVVCLLAISPKEV